MLSLYRNVFSRVFSTVFFSIYHSLMRIIRIIRYFIRFLLFRAGKNLVSYRTQKRFAWRFSFSRLSKLEVAL